ncbi:MAG TPA: prolyl oligopeptidase family serine peptidase [Terriglobales bacterium]|nr:prolyl oligopeptidase family serine peptidase [Terriglobales bacterium]
MRQRFSRTALLFALWLAPVLALAQSFTVEQVMSSPFPTQLTSATNAPIVAWDFDNKGSSNVWVASAPEFVGRQVTHYVGDDGQPIASLQLTPDGRTAVYARGTELNGAGNSANPRSLTTPPKQQVWAADVNNGEPRLLGDMGCAHEGCEDIQISPDGRYAVWATKHELWIAPVSGGNGVARQLTDLQGDVSWPQWSPDGKRIAFRVNRKTHSLVVIGDFAPDFEQSFQNGNATQPGAKSQQPAILSAVHYLAPSVDRDMFPRWSPDGRQIVFIRTAGEENKLSLIPVRPVPWTIFVADASNYTAHPIWHSGQGPRDTLPEFAGPSLQFAGDRIVFASEQTNRNHLYSIPAAGGEPVELTPGDFDVEDVTLSPDRRTILYSSNEDDVDRRHIWRVNVAGGSPQRALTKGQTIEWTPVETNDGRTVLCLGSSATTPALPYRITNSGRELIAKNALPSDFPSAQLVVPKQVIFQSSDGYTIHGQLFVPRNQTGRGPALIFTHGGPPRQMLLGFHYMGYYHNAYAENEYLASLGYTVLSVNYRLSIMYGHDFRQPPNSVWRGASEYNDVVAGAHYLQGLQNVDPQRIGLWGGSYGGFLTAMGLARNSDIFKAGVDFHGVHDWSMFLPHWEDEASAAPDYKEALKLAWDSSPDSTIDRWRSPVLLIQGDDDRNVPFNQTVDLAQRLKKQGVYFEEHVMPDEIHDLLLWSDWVECYKETADFFNRKLKAQQ